jgi:hypothetical protein
VLELAGSLGERLQHGGSFDAVESDRDDIPLYSVHELRPELGILDQLRERDEVVARDGNAAEEHSSTVIGPRPDLQ